MIAIGFLFALICFSALQEEFSLGTFGWFVVGVIMMLHKTIGTVILTLWGDRIERKRHSK